VKLLLPVLAEVFNEPKELFIYLFMGGK